jgi:hypothetical protein
MSKYRAQMTVRQDTPARLLESNSYDFDLELVEKVKDAIASMPQEADSP